MAALRLHVNHEKIDAAIGRKARSVIESGRAFSNCGIMGFVVRETSGEHVVPNWHRHFTVFTVSLYDYDKDFFPCWFSSL